MGALLPGLNRGFRALHPMTASAPENPGTGLIREIRDTIAGKPCLAVMTGAAGSGKTTLARQIAAADNQVLSLDQVRAIISGDQYDQSVSGDAACMLHVLLQERLKRGLTTIVDATSATWEARKPLLDIAARHRIPVTAIAMNTPLEVCLRRNADRPGPPEGSR